MLLNRCRLCSSRNSTPHGASHQLLYITVATYSYGRLHCPVFHVAPPQCCVPRLTSTRAAAGCQLACGAIERRNIAGRYAIGIFGVGTAAAAIIQLALTRPPRGIGSHCTWAALDAWAATARLLSASLLALALGWGLRPAGTHGSILAEPSPPFLDSGALSPLCNASGAWRWAAIATACEAGTQSERR